jgi:dTMP kinase
MTRPRQAVPARFVTFEGVDGSGKSTQMAAVAELLTTHGCRFVQTREPGGTPLGEALRALLIGQEMAPLTETLLMFAARAEHLVQVIRPALASGCWVLCDRFTDATYAYQGAGRGIGDGAVDLLARLVQGDLAPDLTVLVDLDTDEAKRRTHARSVAAPGRGSAKGKAGTAAPAADRFEREQAAFFLRVRRAYLQRAAAQRDRFLVVDGAAPKAAVTAAIADRLAAWLKA